MLIGVVGDDAEDFHGEGAGGRREVDGVAEFEVMENGEVVGDDDALALGGLVPHRLVVTGDDVRAHAAMDGFQIGGDQQDRRAFDADAKIANVLHGFDAGDGLELAFEGAGKRECACRDGFTGRDEEVG